MCHNQPLRIFKKKSHLENITSRKSTAKFMFFRSHEKEKSKLGISRLDFEKFSTLAAQRIGNLRLEARGVIDFHELRKAQDLLDEFWRKIQFGISQYQALLALAYTKVQELLIRRSFVLHCESIPTRSGREIPIGTVEVRAPLPIVRTIKSLRKKQNWLKLAHQFLVKSVYRLFQLVHEYARTRVGHLKQMESSTGTVLAFVRKSEKLVEEFFKKYKSYEKLGECF